MSNDIKIWPSSFKEVFIWSMLASALGSLLVFVLFRKKE